MVTAKVEASTSTQKTPLRMSYEEFLAWADEDVHAEWVNGEVIIQMPPKEEHQRIVDFLLALLFNFVRLFNLGRVISAPFEMKPTPDSNSREPDLVFIAADHLDRLTRDRLAGPADLAVEVVSEDSVYRDRVDKFEEYEAAGVREYWILDTRPGRQRAEFYQLDDQGRYQPATADEKGVYRSQVLPDFWLRPEWLWAEEPPNPLLALAQIVGTDKLIDVLQNAPKSPVNDG
jgi:Uma2 family endonuclease